VLNGESTNTNFIVFCLTRSGLPPTIYCTRGEHTNHYVINVVVVLMSTKNVSGFDFYCVRFFFMPPFRKQWTNSLQSEKKFFKSFYIVNTTKARQGHIIKLIEKCHIFFKNAKQKCKLHKQNPIFLISIDKINVSTCC
jgi:hypothetical protein